MLWRLRRFRSGCQVHRLTLVGMAKALVFLAGTPAALTADDTAVATERTVAHIALANLAAAVLAKDTLALNTGRRQTIFMGQVAVVAKIREPAGLTAYLAGQWLQLV